jgi:hexosaminidase
MLERLAGADPNGPLRVLADIVRPVPLGGRERAGQYTQQTPLNRLVDTAFPESRTAREFSDAVSTMNHAEVREYLKGWQGLDAALKPTLEKNALLREVVPVSAEVSKLASIGIRALDYIESGKPAPNKWVSEQRAYINGIIHNRRPPAEVVIAIAAPIGKLLDRATLLDK